MAEYSAAATLTYSGGSLTFNGASDAYHHDPDACDGLDQAPFRAVNEDRPRTDGAIVYPRLYSGRIVVLAGWVLAASVADRNNAVDDLVTAIDSLMTTAGTYTWTPTGQSAKQITVWAEMPARTSGAFVKRYMFSLIAPDPTIA